MTTKIPVELSSTPGIVDGSNATAITIDSSENISINSGDVTLATASKRYYVPRASDAAATGSLYSPAASDIRLSGAGSSAGELQFEPSSTSGVAMTITSAGNVGIGTTSPATTLHLDASGGAVMRLQRTSANASNKLELSHDGTNAQITSTNNLGISATQATFDGTVLVDGLSNYTGLTVKGSGGSRPMIQWSNANNGALCAIYGTEGNDMVLTSGSSNTERMRIDSSGNLMIGKTNTNVDPDNGVHIQADGTVFSNISSSTYGYRLRHDYNNRFFITHLGVINAQSTSISAISDERLKENIKDLETGLDEVLALKPRRFDWIESEKVPTKNIAGFIAQEVETVLPDLIGSYEHDRVDNAKSLRMGDMIPTLVKAIQEQQEQIEQLKTEIQTLKGE